MSLKPSPKKRKSNLIVSEGPTWRVEFMRLRMSTMNRAKAIAAENAAMDELARISEELDCVNLLIVHHRQHPTVVRKLAKIRGRLLIAKSDALARRAAASVYI